MILGTHAKQPRESRRLRVDYARWLADGETLVNAYVRSDVASPPPPDAPPPEALPDPWKLSPFAASVDVESQPLAAIVTVSGGASLTDYRVTILVTTSTGQIKEDEIMVSVQEVS